MEPIFKDSSKLKGTEVLFFENVELEKSKSGTPSFASVGTLSVLYFKEFNRFILHLNDWRYPLMRRIPITSEGSEGSSFTLNLPALNGFSYILRFPTITNSSAFSNFETILSNNSGYTGKGGVSKKLEASPDDKLSRNAPSSTGFVSNLMSGVSGVTHTFTEVIHSGVDKAKHLAHSMKPGSKGLTSTKKRSNLSDIKNKNFKKEAHSTFKKDFFSTEEGLSKKFHELRSGNENLSKVMEFDSLRKTSDSHAPSMYLSRDEVVESILNNKDLIEQRHFVASS